VSQRGVGVAKCNDRDVHVRGFAYGLMISTRVSDDKESGLHEFILNLIGQSTRGVSGCQSLGTSVLSKLQDCSLAKRARGNNADILRIFNGDNNSCSQLKFLPSFLQVNQVDSISASLPDVTGHGNFQIFCANVNLTSQHLLNIVLLGFHGWRILRSHLC